MIYLSHETLPVTPELIPQLISGAEQILSDQAEGERIDLFGRSATLYQFDYAGFFCIL